MQLSSYVEKTTLPVLAINKFVEDAKITEAMALVNQLDFIDQNAKLISYYGWEKTKVLETEATYKKWLALHKAYNQEIVIAPSGQLDEYWHLHILDTRKYMQDCDFVFGGYLHHYPYFGLTLTEPQEDLEKAFLLTRELFKIHFGHDLLGLAHPCSSKGCR